MQDKPNFELLLSDSRFAAIEAMAALTGMYADLITIKEALDTQLDAVKNTISILQKGGVPVE